MLARCLRLSVLGFSHLVAASASRADSTNAVIPYRTIAELCQLASSADQSKLMIQVFVSSASQNGPASNLSLTIESVKAGNLPLQLTTNGQILNFPHRKELLRENPFVVANQPKGTLRLAIHYRVPLPDELTFRYSRLGDAVAEANRMIKAQAGMMSMFAPKAHGAVFVFPKASAGKATVKVLADGADQEYVADETGRVKLRLEKSVLAKNPEVRMSEKPEVVLPDIN